MARKPRSPFLYHVGADAIDISKNNGNEKFSPLKSSIKLCEEIEVWTKLRLITFVTKAIIRISAQKSEFYCEFFYPNCRYAV